MLFDNPSEAMKLYLNEVHSMLSQRQTECDHGEGAAGVFLIVTCLREQGGILNGSGSPRLFQYMDQSPLSETNHHSVISLSRWRVLRHDHFESDIKAGNDRNYDVILLQPIK